MPYFKENYKLIRIDLRKQQTFDVDTKAISGINFTGNVEHAGNVTMLFIIEEVKETILDFSEGTVKALQIHSAHLFGIKIK